MIYSSPLVCTITRSRQHSSKLTTLPTAAQPPPLQADVYSFGCIVWEALERRRPHAGLDGFQVQTAWALDPEAMRLQRPTPPAGLAPPAHAAFAALAALAEACTAWEPDARPDFRGVLAALRAAGGGGGGASGAATPLASPF